MKHIYIIPYNDNGHKISDVYACTEIPSLDVRYKVTLLMNYE